MKLLAVETATEACSAALLCDGELLQRFQLAPREHTRLILPMIDSLMSEAAVSCQDLDVLAFGCGPGSFTGVRIATGIIHGIALGADLPVVPVSTLAAIAQECIDKTAVGTVFTAMDARIGEIYWGIYQRDQQGIAQLSGKELVTAVDALVGPDQQGFGVGSGWLCYATELSAKLQGSLQGYDADYLPKASVIARLGAVGFANNRAVPVEQAMPVYLRDKVAKKQSER